MTSRFWKFLCLVATLALATTPACINDHVLADEVALLTTTPSLDLAPVALVWRTTLQTPVYLRLNGLDARIDYDRGTDREVLEGTDAILYDYPVIEDFGADCGGGYVDWPEWACDRRLALAGYGSKVANIVPGDYLVEVIDENDNVVMSTSMLTFELGHENWLFINGTATDLMYTYQSVAWEPTDGDELYEAFTNTAEAGVSGRLEVCDVDVTSCSVVADSLPYGQTWAGKVARGQRLRLVRETAAGGDGRFITTLPTGNYYPKDERGFYFEAHHSYEWPVPDTFDGGGISIAIGEFRPSR